ncbi:type II toxin-antitoxin system HicA family toxin [bacterium]|nr:type II toxin-antitoxin system HicA family toxin [bacterium]
MNLNPIAKRKFRRILLQLGFVEDRSRDHVYFRFVHKGRVVARTKISHGGNKDIDKRLLRHILRDQIFLTDSEFRIATEGGMSKEDYIAILIRKSLITW